MAPTGSILIRNVKVFDGVTPRLSPARDVRVENGTIASITPYRKGTDDTGAPTADLVIDGAGRTLMPGLIDMQTTGRSPGSRRSPP